MEEFKENCEFGKEQLSRRHLMDTIVNRDKVVLNLGRVENFLNSRILKFIS